MTERPGTRTLKQRHSKRLFFLTRQSKVSEFNNTPKVPLTSEQNDISS